MAIKNREAAARNPRGGARRGAGRPLGRTDTVPRKGTASEKDRFRALQFEYGKLLKENERLRNELQYGTKFNGTIEEMFLASARGEYVPTQMQAYTGKVILDRQPPSVIETPVTDKDKEENEKEWQKLIEYFAAMAIRETIFQTNGRPAGDSGVPHWVPALVSKVVGETQALLNVPLTEVVPARRQVFWGGLGGHRPDTHRNMVATHRKKYSNQSMLSLDPLVSRNRSGSKMAPPSRKMRQRRMGATSSGICLACRTRRFG